jgi:predicted DsbA family dithiol-disulfide isomerase
MVSRLREAAESLGLPFGDRIKTYNSRLAQELGKWAEVRGCGDKFHHAAFLAYFGEGRNLAAVETLLHIARQADLPLDEARKVVADRSYRQAVDDDWQSASRQAVTAVPTFIMPHGRLVGAQSYLTLARFITAGGAQFQQQ